MGCKGFDKKSPNVARKQPTTSKEKSTNRCVCAQRFDTSFPYKDLPPPAPPDGRADLWELQFCRWWGWNWVRKREVEPAAIRSEEQKKNRYKQKNMDYSDNEVPTRDKDEPKLENHKTKKASFSIEEPETKQCHQIPLTTKAQFKAMCKCLLGKKNMPPTVAKLYNTPSNSVVAFKRCDRQSCGIAEKSIYPICDKKARKESRMDPSVKRENAKRYKGKPEKRSPLKSPESISEQSTIGSLPSESSCSQRPESSTEESTEYLTFRVQHIKNGECDCPCKIPKTPVPVKAEVQQVAVSTSELKKEPKEPEVTVTKVTKETQTFAVETVERICDGTIEHKCPFTEKLVKIKGKKQKTICIKVCCCGSCKEDAKNNVNTEDSLDRKDDNVKKLLLDENQNKDNDIFKVLQDSTNGVEGFDTFTTLPIDLSSFNNKKISKFGTPSKNYPWMQNTESSGTTTSLNNIGNWKSVSSDLYDLLNPDVGTNNNPIKFQDLIGVNENLSYLKQIDVSKRTQQEDRILLDAICDAILKEHNEKTGLDEFKFETKNDANVNYRDLGVVCHLKSDQNVKTDAYTELSKVLVNTEDVGVQLAKISELNGILEQSDNSKLDTMMGILDNILYDPKDSKNENYLNNFQFNSPGTDLAKKSTAFKRTPKRCATVLGKEENLRNKKIKKEKEINFAAPPNVRIKNIFTKIEDIVNKSKEKTIEIQKVLNQTPIKQEFNEQTENILHIHELNQNIKQNSDDNIAAPKNLSKRIYPISSDTFKKMYCESKDIRADMFGNPFCNSEQQPQSTVEDKTEPQIYIDTCVNKTDDDSATALKPRISKLGVQHFIVCDEKSKVEPKLSSSSISRLLGKKIVRNISSRGSLIPIRRRSNTNC